jgi:catechol 2,3-dioxygenase-like lactoylglutathione lyase family enzyme
VNAEPLFARVDHLVVAVRDLDAAASAYSAMLGLTPSWRGAHPALATRNVIFGLANCYVELLAVEPGAPPSPLADALAGYLARKPEGLFAIALATDDLDRTAAHLRAAGIAPGTIADGEAVADDGTRRRWRSLILPRESSRGVNVIAIEHASLPAMQRSPVAGAADASVRAVDHVVLFSDDMRGALGLWRDTFGIPERWQREIKERGTLNVGLKLAGITIELVAPLGNVAGTRGERLFGAAYVVDDCDAAVARLRGGPVPVSDTRTGLAPRTRVATVKWPEGVPTLLIEHLPR